MGTEIKPGQVWKDRDDNARLLVNAIYPTRVGFTWIVTGAATSMYVDEFLSRFVLATPAPLDPSKVKAGDTVTLLVDPPDRYPAFTVAGETHSLGGSTVHLGGWRVDALPDYVTLTAHQPAPEPEPEWKPGTVAKATVRGVADVQVMRLHPDPEPTEDDPSWVSVDLVDRKGKPLNGWDGKFVHNAVDVTDVRPLVVIDPADVDVDALLDSALARLSDDPHVPTTYTVLKTALSVLGIEAIR